jgi:hypothetical protein
MRMSELSQLYEATRGQARRTPTWRLRRRARRVLQAVADQNACNPADLVRLKAMHNELAERVVPFDRIATPPFG